MREWLATSHQHQKEFYIDGKPYDQGTLVWLHAPFTGTHKVYHPWTGPYKIVKQLYRIQKLQGWRRQCKVVHSETFPANVRLDHHSDSSSAEPEVTSTSDNNISLSRTPNIAESLELVEEDDIREHSRKAVSLPGAAPTLNTLLGIESHHHDM